MFVCVASAVLQELIRADWMYIRTQTYICVSQCIWSSLTSNLASTGNSHMFIIQRGLYVDLPAWWSAATTLMTVLNSLTNSELCGDLGGAEALPQHYERLLWIIIMNYDYEQLLWTIIMNNYYEQLLWTIIMKNYYEEIVRAHTHYYEHYYERLLWTSVQTLGETIKWSS